MCELYELYLSYRNIISLFTTNQSIVETVTSQISLHKYIYPYIHTYIFLWCTSHINTYIHTYIHTSFYGVPAPWLAPLPYQLLQAEVYGQRHMV